MGLLDFFGGGSPPEKAKKLKAKVTQKYGDPTTRQKAIATLGEMKIPEAVTALMARFTIAVDPQTTDADEKDHVMELIVAKGSEAVSPVKDFLWKTEQASSWALRVLEKLLPESEVIGLAVELLSHMGAGYSRDPERKVVVLQFLADKQDPRIAPAVVPFLEDMADDVKTSALKVLGPRKFEPAREPILHLLAAEETARRVKTAALAALAESNFSVETHRGQVEAALTEPYFLDKSGAIQRR